MMVKRSGEQARVVTGKTERQLAGKGRPPRSRHPASASQPLALRLREGREHAPHACLGPLCEQGNVARVWLPGAVSAWLEPGARAMQCIDAAGLFEWAWPAQSKREDYRIRWLDEAGQEHVQRDPYAFPLDLKDEDLGLFSHGGDFRAWRLLGAHPMARSGVAGTRFAVWAPNAERVSVIGDFNRWNGLAHPMSVHGASGVWELFIPEIGPGALYKFELRNRNTGEMLVKIDPFARRLEMRPRTACIVDGEAGHVWDDATWLLRRRDWQRSPMAVYELHAGSWRRHDDGRFLDYRELADALLPELLELGFTHVELMPITEHPFDGSWGYQTIGYFAPTSRFGSPDDLRYFVDMLHRNGIGVILDWVPGHFPKDSHGLARFDGTALFEHADPRRGETAEWGTLAFNFARDEVRSFLISSAICWLEEFHIDGLRIDAVAAMLYLDYGREDGNWVANMHGGNENLEAVSFLQALNTVTHRECPGSMTIAEESTSWPAVTRPVHLGGLGFSMKWNMGWMHDTLAYFRHEPVHRRFHHDSLTFGLLYAHTENFVLPLSHDEVVHGKGSLLDKMPGDRWQKFANLRLLYSYMYAYPGKKLLFMGAELAVPSEWSHDDELPHGLKEEADHAGVRRLLVDLNAVYSTRSALYLEEFDSEGFEWIDCHDADQSVLSFLRRGGGEMLVAVCNFTPVPRYEYRIGVPTPGRYREVLNSDASLYGGSNVGNLGSVEAEALPWMGRPWSLSLTLPPLAAVMFELADH